MKQKVIKNIRHIIKQLLDIIVHCFNRILYLITPKRSGVNTEEKRDKKVIVSLTSMPSRIDMLDLCIESLLRQTMKPDMIVLYLDNNLREKVLPKKLLKQTERGLTIKYCDKTDLRSHTKYFYVMQEFPEDIIITVDDDVYYNKNMVRNLYESYERYPNCISCIKMHEILLDNDQKFLPYNSWRMNISGKESVIPSKKFIAIGAGGILYPPNCMNKELFNKQKIKDLCLKADDIWLKAMQLENDIKVVRAFEKKQYIYNVLSTQKDALFKDNLVKSENDIYINNVLSKYIIGGM